MRIFFWTSVVGLLSSCHPVLIYHNGRINQKASAMAIKNGRIIAVGSDTEIFSQFDSSTPKIDLHQKRVLPGFIESHGHFIGVGNIHHQLELTGTSNQEQIIDLVAKKAGQTPPGIWIKGRGWDQNDWPEPIFPTQEALSRVSPKNPVVLTRIDGHAIWCNQLALQIAGIDAHTLGPEGGQILRDQAGHPTGVFIDNAMALLTRQIPKPTHAELVKAARAASQEALRLGITSFHDAGSSQETIEAYQELIQSGIPMPRLYVMLDGSDENLLNRYYQSGPIIDDRLSIRSVKFYADGALGSRGAALLESYQDDKDNSGLLLYSQEQLKNFSQRAAQHGFQVATHAIGDRAGRLVLDTYENLPKGLRPRMEHAQIVHTNDLLRFSRLGVIASVQPTHYVSDRPWASHRLGAERTLHEGYPWLSFLEQGVVLAAGSDAPVESLNPFLGIHAAVTRTDPKERLTIRQAMDAYTIGGAYAEFQEHQKGRLEPGYLADFIVLSQDIFEIPLEDIKTIRVEMTVF